MPFYNVLSTKYKSKNLRDIVDNVLQQHYPTTLHAFSFQHRLNIPSPWNLLDGIGSLKDYENVVERDFNTINPIFRNTIVEDIISEFDLYRTRCMQLDAKQCYSIHSDFTWRIHFPIYTSNKAFFYFPDLKEHLFLEPDKIYLVNTTLQHTFVNANFEERVHLVACTDMSL